MMWQALTSCSSGEPTTAGSTDRIEYTNWQYWRGSIFAYCNECPASRGVRVLAVDSVAFLQIKLCEVQGSRGSHLLASRTQCYDRCSPIDLK